jgi:hypothetical protein
MPLHAAEVLLASVRAGKGAASCAALLSTDRFAQDVNRCASGTRATWRAASPPPAGGLTRAP